MAYLLLVDTTQTQRYIFNSNRMRENIGASYLVAKATTEWVLQSIVDLKIAHNIADASKLSLNDQCYEDGLDVEVIYAAGGNALAIFRAEGTLNNFLRNYSQKLLREMPNAPIYTTQCEFDWDETDRQKKLSETVDQLFKNADEAKRMRPRSEPVLGLGVTVACRSTGLPAIAMSPKVCNADDEEETQYPVSAEILAKLEAASPPGNAPSEADKALRQLELNEDLYRYPSDFDDMVPRKGEANYVAIVHADGDGIGDVVKRIGQGQSNRDYIKARRKFADGLAEATRKALQKTQKKLESYLESDKNVIELRVTKNARQKFIPFRPLIFAGDDITFVCDGRVGLSLATTYMNAFAEETKKLTGGPFTASAGVSIVRTHYPFARAYRLAEQLTKQAKVFRRENNLEIGCLDWHFTVGGLYAPIEQIRKREYRSREIDESKEKNEKDKHKRLTLRPVALKPPTTFNLRHRAWPLVERSIREFQKPDEWLKRRNKAKALRDALREGSNAVVQFRRMYDDNELLPPLIDDQNWFREDGYYRGCCGYFDGLELADWHLSLEEANGN